MDLRAGFASVDRARSGQRSPFLALTDAPSRTARDQSISPWLPNSSSTAWCNRRHRPALVHSLNRRCAVGTVTPNDGGSKRQEHPLVSTNTIAVNTARSSTGVVPPPCGRGSNPGINGSANAHNSSGTNRRDNSSTTRPDHDRPRSIHVRHPLRLGGWLPPWVRSMGAELGANVRPLVPLELQNVPWDAVFSQVTQGATVCSRIRIQPVRVRLLSAPRPPADSAQLLTRPRHGSAQCWAEPELPATQVR